MLLTEIRQKNAVKREADQKKKSALQKLLQKKRYQKQYRAAKESKKSQRCGNHIGTKIYRKKQKMQSKWWLHKTKESLLR